MDPMLQPERTKNHMRRSAGRLFCGHIVAPFATCFKAAGAGFLNLVLVSASPTAPAG